MSQFTRRHLLATAGSGFGLLALADLMAKAEDSPANPLAAKKPHYAPKAKRCIFLFMPGGPSQLDLFDPKPKLQAENGKPLPFARPKLERTKTGNLFGSPWKFARYGKCGTEVSELLPHLAGRVDDLCVVRSAVADNINHTGAALQMNTGEQAFSRPSLGSWLTYGLGTENQNLPGFVVVAPEPPFQGSPLWSASFLPAAYQGTWVRDPANPVADLKPSDGDTTQRAKLNLLSQLNEAHKHGRMNESALNARIASFELAFRMQAAAPEAFDLSREPLTVRAMYGLDEKPTEVFGRQCLLARRLVERGVRFVQVYDTGTGGWDHHGDIRKQLPARCRGIDQPIAALLTDLKHRGLLEDTLVVWGGEFGRSPTAEGGDGREHHPFGFTMFLAGGGIKGGIVHGATDEYGWHAVENKVHIHDLHATILHLMGLDHTKLTYRYGGRDYRLTDVHGTVVKEILT
jgi:hypothetical protein